MRHLPQISISVIEHDQQAYDTVGNYTEIDDECLDVEISKMNAEYEFLVATHEFIEWFLCQKRGISTKKITAFDIAFEKKRKIGNTDEPGHDPKSPYRKEHKFAEKIEKMLAKELKIDWKKYTKFVDSL